MSKRCFIILGLILFVFQGAAQGDESLFTPKLLTTPLIKKAFAFLEQSREEIIANWIYLAEIPSPSGQEGKRAAYMEKIFKELGLSQVGLDKSGNVQGVWPGQKTGKKILVTAHLDTVFQGVKSIRVKREGNLLKAPGIGDDTASLINLIWTIKALQNAGFKPKHNYYFLATVGEEIGFVGMKAYLAELPRKFDLVLALDGDLGKVHYGALGFGGGRVVYRGPGAHTMESRGIPNPAVAVAKTITRLYQIDCPAQPLEKWTILNVGMIGGGKVTNAVPQEAYFTIDLRSASQKELMRIQNEIEQICRQVAYEENVFLELNLRKDSPAYQLPGARNSFLVKTLVDILEYLKIKDIEVDPLGSTEANVGLAYGLLSVNLGRTYGRFKHSLREEAEIDGLFLAMKQIILLLASLEKAPLTD